MSIREVQGTNGKYLCSSATITFNGYSGASYLGGSLASAITIEEIAQ